jgi:hypothetical protein
VINGTEECDGDDLNGETCSSLGYEGGTLSCTASCTFDASACTGGQDDCGNGTIDDGEDCDSGDLDGWTCEDEGFDGGTLACDDENCEFDVSGCCYSTCAVEGETQCDENVVETCALGDNGCLYWEDTTDCENDGLICVEENDAASCEELCTDTCPGEGVEQCDGDVVQICTMNLNGCVEWADATDCANTNQICEEDGDTASCVYDCTDECQAVDVMQCNGDVLEICAMGGDGCLDWVTEQDCTQSGLLCDPNLNPPQCVTPPSGDSCVEAIPVDSFPYMLEGTDFTADFTDSQPFEDATDCAATQSGAADAVFEVALQAGDLLHVWETGDMNAVLHILDTCDATSGTCYESADDYFNADLYYTAANAETVYVVIEAYYEFPSNTDYSIHMELMETICDDSTDNDGDGATDCEDPDCFGETGCETEALCGDSQDNDDDGLTDCTDDDCFGVGPCTSETNCSDGQDNDDDGATDCDDSECSGELACMDRIGVWEEFETDDENDLVGCVLTFTPDATTYSHAHDCSTAGALVYAPGSGDATSALSLGGDDFSEYTFSLVSGFEFFGVTYTSLFVSSDGYITFGAGESDYNLSSMDEIFRVPRIMLLADDFAPNSGGNVIVDEYNTGIVVITYEDVPYWFSSDLVTLQLVLDTNTGVITMIYNQVDRLDDGIVGVTNGAGAGTTPAETDFVPPPPPKINEVYYDNDGNDDTALEYVELYFGGDIDLTGYALVHHNGYNGDVLWALDLSSITIPSDGLFVFGGASVPNVDWTWTDAQNDGAFSGSAGIQNGADSLVLYADWGTATETAVDAVEWQTGANHSFAETTPAPDVEFGSWNTSIGRYPDGMDTDDNSADFFVQWWGTPGEINTPTQPMGYVRLTGSTQGDDTYPITIPNVGTSTNVLTISGGLYSWLPTNISDIQVGVRIKHTYRGDLNINLDGPGPTNVFLFNGSGSGNDVETVFDMITAVHSGDMDDFNGQTAQDTWTLTVEDTYSGDGGEILEWVIWVQGT